MRRAAIAPVTKIATCCHCGTTASLTLDRTRHSLSCASCGAPLRDLKPLPRPAPVRTEAVSHQPTPRSFPAAAPAWRDGPPRPVAKQAKKSKKPRKGWFGKKLKDLAEDLFDAVEDILD